MHKKHTLNNEEWLSALRQYIDLEKVSGMRMGMHNQTWHGEDHNVPLP